jgi:hypothetical protein
MVLAWPQRSGAVAVCQVTIPEMGIICKTSVTLSSTNSQKYPKYRKNF